MARSGTGRRRDGPGDLAEQIERLAAHIGNRIGAGIAAAIASTTIAVDAPPQIARRRQRCSHEGCERDAAAKGLCKSHYNLMLYHRRRAERGLPSRRRRS